ncbi:hypothetical protein [Rhodococcus erythropolis]|uniref:Uncharacterized protein n=1 Tax=Rhodococcus erythropolis TaxID=1833 RepID=A0A8I1D5C8_RHOER|nr:hypothetical protein [Rhodococcus erythropolis]MBH5144075.1 hypothetical protein [Rhodococcus erythropolis]
MTGTASASALDQYLDIPLVIRDAAYGPGAGNPELPSDRATLARLLDEVRASDATPNDYETPLYQYRLVVVTDTAGFDLPSWAAGRCGLHPSQFG